MAPPEPPLEDLPHDLPSLVEAEGDDGPAAEESAGDETAAPARRRRRQMAEQGTQATDDWDKPDWTRFDLGRALKVLRTGSDDEVKRVLQRLPIRHYHQPAEKMK